MAGQLFGIVASGNWVWTGELAAFVLLLPLLLRSL